MKMRITLLGRFCNGAPFLRVTSHQSRVTKRWFFTLSARHATRVTRHDSTALIALAKLSVTLLAPLALSGCYLMQAASGQLAINVKREPIAKVIAAPETPAQLQARLKLISEAREFASKELGLPDNKSYRTYVDLKRDYVVWNVFATDRFSVEARRWCFPVTGCVVYRGYFNEDAAQDYARKIRLRGGDAFVSGTTAYSTLGHFADPVLSTMLRWNDAQIVSTLFHELSHQVFFAQDDSGFNEAFATVVEEEGLKRWLAKRGDTTSKSQNETISKRSREFIELQLTTRDRLRDLYATEPPSFELYIKKQQEFGRLKYEYSKLKESWGGYTGYDYWFNRPLGNAHLISAATYESCAPKLEQLLTGLGNDLPKFYAAVKAMKYEERKTLCEGH